MFRNATWRKFQKATRSVERGVGDGSAGCPDMLFISDVFCLVYSHTCWWYSVITIDLKCLKRRIYVTRIKWHTKMKVTPLEGESNVTPTMATRRATVDMQ
jgi:hypothetical protein